MIVADRWPKTELCSNHAATNLSIYLKRFFSRQLVGLSEELPALDSKIAADILHVNDGDRVSNYGRLCVSRIIVGAKYG